MKQSFIVIIVVGIVVILLGVFIMARRSVRTVQVPSSQNMYQQPSAAGTQMQQNETGSMTQNNPTGTTGGTVTSPAQELNSVEQSMPSTSTDLGTVDQITQ